MKFSTIASASLAAATNSSVLLTVKSDNILNGLSFTSLHEGAAMNYLFVANSSTGFPATYDDSAKTVSVPFIEVSDFFLQNLSPFVGFDTDPSSPVTISNEILSIGGVSTFYGCQGSGDVTDPYSYIENSYAVVDKKLDGYTCYELQIKAVAGSATSSSSAPHHSGSATATTGNGTTLTTGHATTAAPTHSSTTIVSGAAISGANFGLAAIVAAAAALLL
ncbi:hypothetical protein CANCADRAFT_113410 [Tortispora caseinolytica NRRL Y-17796]|uniref:Uncharacterized protein n=1 Tax=Tortispora caseinolytica NRRL Y-17796 TaxID=767744 RepID=A0A1E4TGT3_9ASCO|nr:hypothetical protein CANCADRAFT_113410 [Tortispora caseinolytica NRRL Y-17796]